jgi:sugar lactone lactonase YvrE
MRRSGFVCRRPVLAVLGIVFGLSGCSAAAGPAVAPRLDAASGFAAAPGSAPATISTAARESLRPAAHPLARGAGWMSPAAKNCVQKLYVSSYRLDYVSIYCVRGHNQAPIGQITDGIAGPEGEATDGRGNLYVTNTNANTVTEYALGRNARIFTYSAGLTYPAGVAVDGSGNVYVSSLSPASVEVFPQGVDTPSLKITSAPYPIDLALDAAGNLFVTTYTANFSNGEVLEYGPGETQGTNLGIVTKGAGGIALDKTSDIVTADQSLPGVLVFPPGNSQPARLFGQNAVDPDPVRFDADSRRAYVGDAVGNAVYVYDYASGALIDTITDGIDGPNGVALDPAPPLPAVASARRPVAAARASGPSPAVGFGHSAGGWISPEAKTSKGLIYVSDFANNIVQIYSANGSNQSPIGSITDGISGPEGDFVDKNGNLYVANVTNYTVTVYPPGSYMWALRYTGLQYPTNATAGKDGVVFIPDLSGNKVVEYRKGSTRSKLTIPVSDPQGVVLDNQRDLYVSYNDALGGHVNEYPPGSTTGTNLGLPIAFAGGDALDGAGNLLVADQGTAAVYVFAPGAITPSRAITQGLQDPFRLALDKSFKHLYVADPEANEVLIYDYQSGTLENTITNGLQSVYGVAVFPQGS